MLLPYGLLLAPVVAAFLFWGSWPWMAASAAVALIEYGTLQRSQRFSARVWRTIGFGRHSRHERVTEGAYVLAAAAGLALLVVALLSL